MYRLPQDGRTHATLPWMWEPVQIILCRTDRQGKIVKERKDGKVATNLPQAVVHHSLTGFEWGYVGSGPADLALNVLHLVLPPGCDQEAPVKCYKGWTLATAWSLHQRFKSEVIAGIPEPGGTIQEADLRTWIKAHLGDGWLDMGMGYGRLSPAEIDPGTLVV